MHIKKIRTIIYGVLLSFASLFSVANAEESKSNIALNQKQQSIVAIAALTAQGDLDKLNMAFNNGLDNGLTINEIKEILIQMYAYTGFPRSLNGIITFEKTLTERQNKGIQDPIGETPKAVRTDMNKYEVGRQNLATLTGIAPSDKRTGYTAFVPTIEIFLKEHLFADIFERGVLDYQTRELVTVSTLASLGNVNAQLRSHMNVAMHNGLTELQLRQLITILGQQVNTERADNATNVLNQIVAPDQVANNQATTEPQTHIIHNDTKKLVNANPNYFTGNATVAYLFPAGDSLKKSGGYVTFEPGARTAWHSHPNGQLLIVTDGIGRVQQWGGDIMTVNVGDVIWFPAGVKHWHGAAPDSSFTHIALADIVDGKSSTWFEKVTDEQYKK